VSLNPPADSPIVAGTEVIAIAEDDAVLLAAQAQAPNGDLDVSAIVDADRPPPQPQRSLILGWNRRAPSIINELDKYVMEGSVVTVVADWAPAAAAIEADCSGLRSLSVDFREGDTTARRLLESLDLDGHDHVIVLCYSDTLPAQRADARTLVTLLHLRDIASRTGAEFSITSEMIDDRNRALAEVTQVDDVIVSENLISLLLTQISENRHLTSVFDELFAAEGSELYMRSAGHYVQLGVPVSFATIVESARRQGEVAIGYRLRGGRVEGAPDGEPRSGALGVVINPAKSERVVLGESDRVVVLAED
jgi:hypothetical protein